MQISVPNQHAKVIVDVAIQMEKAVNDMRSQFSKLNLGSDISRQFESAFKGLGSNLNKILDLGGKNSLSTSEIERLSGLQKTVNGQFVTLTRRFEELGGEGGKNLQKLSPQFVKLTSFLKDVVKETTQYNDKIADLKGKQEQINVALEENKKKYNEVTEAINNQKKQQEEYNASQTEKRTKLVEKRDTLKRNKSDIDTDLSPYEKIDDQLKLIKVRGKEAGTTLDQLLQKSKSQKIGIAKVWNDAFNKLNGTLEETEKRIDELKAKSNRTSEENQELLYLTETQKPTLQAGVKQVGKFDPNSKVSPLKQYEELTQQQVKLQQAIKEANDAIAQQDEETKKVSKSEYTDKIKSLEQQQKALNSEINKNKKALEGLSAKIAAIKQPNIDELRKQLSELAGIPLEEVPNDFDGIIAKTEELVKKAPEEFVNTLKELIKSSKEQGQNSGNIGKIAEESDGVGRSLERTNEELEMFKSRIKYFFSAYSAVQMLRRAVQQTFETVKELDASMTEIAVVTDYTVGDMWQQLPRYTNAANELGVSIKDMYDSTKLFYQTGLDSNSVWQLTTETMRMARIAGLDAEEATNRMTSQLRSFNMELNQTSAQNVADVYSKLAAMSASNVDELSNAMSKTASIASNAGSSFENTAAFLAQIIKKMVTCSSNAA